ncbi:MAG: hypothetical protein WCC60_03160 [Ilumatobacteraceae bacterium]
MTLPEVELRAAWRQLAGNGHDHRLDELLARHCEAHRRYHTATHVMWVLRHLTDMVAAGEVATDLPAVQLAALFHDVVYDPTAADNEARSARIAEQVAAELGWPGDRRQLVGHLVLATAGHRPQGGDAALLVDADLAILGADCTIYEAYVEGVRAEYAHVDDDAWISGRGAVLRGFLALPHLFNTSYMRGMREAQAIANITAELAALHG